MKIYSEIEHSIAMVILESFADQERFPVCEGQDIFEQGLKCSGSMFAIRELDKAWFDLKSIKMRIYYFSYIDEDLIKLDVRS